MTCSRIWFNKQNRSRALFLMFRCRLATWATFIWSAYDRYFYSVLVWITSDHHCTSHREGDLSPSLSPGAFPRKINKQNANNLLSLKRRHNKNDGPPSIENPIQAAAWCRLVPKEISCLLFHLKLIGNCMHSPRKKLRQLCVPAPSTNDHQSAATQSIN